MAMIAGRRVRRGDKLWHYTLRRWATVIEAAPDGHSLVVEVQGLGHNGKANLQAVDDTINGMKELYWHEPIKLDLPIDDVSHIQNALEVLIVFGDKHAKCKKI